jgi:cell division protease FtsH
MQINFSEIEQKKQTLELSRQLLKEHFIGIDRIIDELLNYIQIWYLLPDILRRPIIINLWGMTGVGKTDLVRRLVKYLNFQDRFVEVELTNGEVRSWYNSVGQILQNNGIDDSKPAIVLFDEIQRFNTLQADGTPIPNPKFADFWELLSDGKLSRKSKEDLDYYIQEYLFQQKRSKQRREQGEEDEDHEMDIYDAQQIKSLLKLDQELIEIAEMSGAEIIQHIKEAKQKKIVYEPVDHSKTLIIIGGNLDSAFTIASHTSESDVDADIFHAFTEKLTMIDIKNALSKKFRPEQVARFGNIHLIYHSLRKVDFENLITKEVDRICQDILQQYQIEIRVDQSIHELIYRNGVFPAQGVRPVFSSIVDILETNLSQLLFTALMKKASQISISYDFNSSEIVSQVGEIHQRIPFTGRIDRIRNSNLQDVTANTSVHEAGHAVAYVLLFGLAPLQLKSKLANSYADGFTFPHEIYETKENLIKKMQVYLAGGVAEELVFGADRVSLGHSKDREQVTIVACNFVRKYGFTAEFFANYGLEDEYEMDKMITNRCIETIIAEQIDKTRHLLSTNISFLKTLANRLMAVGSLEADAVQTIAHEFGYRPHVQKEGFLLVPPYQQLLEE